MEGLLFLFIKVQLGEDIVMQSCNPSIPELESRASGGEGQPGPYSET